MIIFGARKSFHFANFFIVGYLPIYQSKSYNNYNEYYYD